MEDYLGAQKPLYEVKANLFKGLSHPLRVRILELLADGGEVPVGDLITDTGLEPSHLSGHLAVLRRHGLVRSDRRGSQVFYRLAYPEIAELLRVARTLLGEVLRDTRERLDASAELRPIGGGDR